jgi:hypothetical protein
MRQHLSSFLLLPLMFLPARVSADLGSRMGIELPPRDLNGGNSRRIVTLLVRRVRAVSRLFVPRTASEMHVIAAAATAEAKTTRPPTRRRRAARATSVRTLPASPRVRPQTT